MSETSRFGFEKFGGPYGGSGSDLGAKFSTTDRDLLDKLLTFFENHQHDGGNTPVALASPTVAPTSTTSSTGGSIARGTVRYYKYTLVDAYGFETAGSPELAVTLPGAIHVTTAPILTGSNAVGSLLPQGSYYYALTGNTASGQTILGPQAIITVHAGQNRVSVFLPALTSGIESWNVWRMAVTEQGWTKVFASVAPGTHVDVGYASGECLCDPTTQPPTVDLVASGTYSITITPDSTALATAASWRLYQSDTSGSYGSASLIAAVVPTVVGASAPLTYLDTGASLLTGQPPLVSNTIKPSHSAPGGGANSHFEPVPFDHTVPATGVQQPVRFGSPYTSIDSNGSDFTLIYEPVGTVLGDEIQVNGEGVFASSMRIIIDGVAPGDVVQGYLESVEFDVLVPGLIGNIGQLVCPPGETTIDGVIAFPARFMPFGSRHRFAFTIYYAGSAPTRVQVGGGLVMLSGSPLGAEFYPAPTNLVKVPASSGQVNLSWDSGVDTGSYQWDVLCYAPGTPASPVSKQTVYFSPIATVTGLTDGVLYTFVVMATKNVNSVDVYSTPAVLTAVASNVVFSDGYATVTGSIKLKRKFIASIAGHTTVEAILS